ncbi:Os07g0634750 [Oryza sativa Japonica Group]|uniref:Uncharacterized protein n=2 Tax=Oryza sativa subsp. japonica TaxID=39947 RepID=Q7F258_ORYSJ|nr:hypothetical protein [Oryza sativa Japonica Group]BAC10032.1 hypothetical protein [Oryza sativa Japonica Group]BAT02807.1 Os07g0634750 [Oryza sativa Japonica Group]
MEVGAVSCYRRGSWRRCAAALALAVVVVFAADTQRLRREHRAPSRPAAPLPPSSCPPTRAELAPSSCPPTRAELADASPHPRGSGRRPLPPGACSRPVDLAVIVSGPAGLAEAGLSVCRPAAAIKLAPAPTSSHRAGSR